LKSLTMAAAPGVDLSNSLRTAVSLWMVWSYTAKATQLRTVRPAGLVRIGNGRSANVHKSFWQG